MRQLDYLRPASIDEAVAASPVGPAPGSWGAAATWSTTSSSAWPDPTCWSTSRGSASTRSPRRTGCSGSAPTSATPTWPPIRSSDATSRCRAALLAGASGQIRNQATTAGNLLQRTRCVYFQDVTTPCNKREPGSGCSAADGYGRYNAVLGASEHCVATHPSDMAVGMAAADAVVVVVGPDGERRLPLADLHRLPGDEPERDTTLGHGELITAVELTPTAVTRHATYYKARDRASYAFALVSVAAGLSLDDDGVVHDVAIAWGGVAHQPWRATRAQDLLRGERLTEDAVRSACEVELESASAGHDNAFKPAMVRNITALVLTGLAERGRP